MCLSVLSCFVFVLPCPERRDVVTNEDTKTDNDADISETFFFAARARRSNCLNWVMVDWFKFVLTENTTQHN